MKYKVYVLRSQMDGRLYKGMTENLDRRIKEHNSGYTKSTKAFIPWNLVYSEEFDSIKEAVDREKFLKTGVGREYLKKILAS